MSSTISLSSRLKGALLGMFIGDALAMPAHWYYDTSALQRDYGEIREYLKPNNPHPDSILWRSAYTPASPEFDILGNQAKYWGKRNIHYHQFLRAGENTLNVKLARELLLQIEKDGRYNRDRWLERMIAYLTAPDSHNDTYVEEYLRIFFNNLAEGKSPHLCGRLDEKHIGGYSLMLPLLIVLAEHPLFAKETALKHLRLTHGGESMQLWGKIIADTMLHIFHNNSMEESIDKALSDSPVPLRIEQLLSLLEFPDKSVVGKHFSSACYVDLAVPATLYLALKYCDQPEKGLIANTMCGGDNAGRGAVLGALFGGVHCAEAWPRKWIDGLVQPPPMIRLTID